MRSLNPLFLIPIFGLLISTNPQIKASQVAISSKQSQQRETSIVVTKVVGAAFVWHDGVQRPAVAGESLKGDESLRTGLGGRVRVMVRGSVILSMAEHTKLDLSCKDISRCGIEVSDGVVRASVAGEAAQPVLLAKVAGNTCRLTRGAFVLSPTASSAVEASSSADEFSCQK
jgi:hypothetical protein